MCAFLFNLFAIFTIFLVDDIATSSFRQTGWVFISPFWINFFLNLRISSSSECTATTFEAYLKTFSISSSLSTNKFPVEEPANNLIPQHPSKFFNFSKIS